MGLYISFSGEDLHYKVLRQRLIENFVTRMHRYQGRITNQICRLGVSCDWDRVAFTMNPALSKAVAETFVRLHDDGIIYRANRLVNWCVAMNTTLSNLEVSPLLPTLCSQDTACRLPLRRSQVQSSGD